MGEGGLELRFSGLSAVRTVSGNPDLSGVSRVGVSDRVSRFYPISTRPVEDPVEELRHERRSPLRMALLDTTRRTSPTTTASDVPRDDPLALVSQLKWNAEEATSNSLLRGLSAEPSGTPLLRHGTVAMTPGARPVPRPTAESLRSRSYANTRCRRSIEQ